MSDNTLDDKLLKIEMYFILIYSTFLCCLITGCNTRRSVIMFAIIVATFVAIIVLQQGNFETNLNYNHPKTKTRKYHPSDRAK